MDKLRKDLDALAKLGPKQTLNIKTMTPINHRSFIGATQRLLWRENRDKTIATIEQIIDQAIVNLPRDIDLIVRLKQARTGINNLKETYSDDATVQNVLANCLSRIENVATRFERRLITSIEQIPDLLARELVTQTNEHEYDGLILVRQTPIASRPVSQPDSKNETPVRTPIDARTPLRTPAETPPPTPPSTPTRHQSPSTPEQPEHSERSEQLKTPEKTVKVPITDNSSHHVTSHFLAQPRRNLRPIASRSIRTKVPQNQSTMHPIGLMRPTLTQQLQFGILPWRSVSSVGWAGHPVGQNNSRTPLMIHETTSGLPRTLETTSGLPRTLEKTPNPPQWFDPRNPLNSLHFLDRHNPLNHLNPLNPLKPVNPLSSFSHTLNDRSIKSVLDMIPDID
jgi:hypothetical protein